MLIGVISDTHGDLSRVELCSPYLKGVELLLHAGDLYEDAHKIGEALGIKALGVTGNCDYMVKGPSEEMLSIGSRRIYLTHGHLYKVKKDLNPLVQRSKVLGVDVTIFGHTHMPTVFRRDGVLFVNPGSLHSPRQMLAPSMAVLDVGRHQVRARVISLVKTGR